MNPLVVIIPAFLCGLIIAGGAYLARRALAEKIQKDVDWVRSTAMRFSPDPINAPLWCILYYATFLLILLLFLWIAWPQPIFAIPLWLLTLYAPKLVIELLWKSRRKKIDLQLPPTIASMANSIKAGLTLVQSLERLAEQAPEPIRTEFKTMANQYAYGSDLETVIR